MLVALPGLHSVHRGAEVAFAALAQELSELGEDVTVIGSGPKITGTGYGYRKVSVIPRTSFEKFPKFPPFRHEYAYEELTFIPGLTNAICHASFDVTLTCSYPFTNWLLQRRRARGPAHVFVTQNGDWPAYSNDFEFRLFNCDGLVCTNPDYYDRNRDSWKCALIPNGVDIDKFHPGVGLRVKLGLPPDKSVVLMTSALIASKNVNLGIRAVSTLPQVHLAVAGDGPQRKELTELASQLLPQRYSFISLPASSMPDLYRCADVFLHLSSEESFGNVYLEALATGLPIVAPDKERVRWIVGDGEYLTNAYDTSSISYSIQLALAEGNRHSASRVTRASDFSWREVAKKYRDFLSEVLSFTNGK